VVRPAGRRSAAVAATLALGLATGCGEDPPPTKVVARSAIPEAEVARRPAGSPERTLLELVRAAQRNDPTGVRQRITAEWGATPARLVRAMPQMNALSQAFGVPRILDVTRSGRRARIRMRWGGQSATFVLVRAPDGWRLARILQRGRPLEVAGVRSP
jgi:hypothetical protein